MSDADADNAPRRRELHGVVDHLGQSAPEPIRVTPCRHPPFIALKHELHGSLVHGCLELADHALHQRPNIVVAVHEPHRPRFQTGHVEKVVDQRSEPSYAVIHRAKRLALRRVELAQLFVDQQFDVADDGGHRRGKLVRDVSIEGGTGSVCFEKPGVCFRQFRNLRLEARHDAVALRSEVRVGLIWRHDLLATSQELLERRREGPRVDRLLNEAVAANRETRRAIPFRRDRHDRNLTKRCVTTEAKRNFVSVESGNVQVDQHEVRSLRARQSHAL